MVHAPRQAIAEVSLQPDLHARTPVRAGDGSPPALPFSLPPASGVTGCGEPYPFRSWQPWLTHSPMLNAAKRPHYRGAP